MIETLSPTVLFEIVRGAKVTATSGGNFAAYVNLKNMQGGDEIAFWLEYDIDGQDQPQISGSAVTISYDDLTSIIEDDEGDVVIVNTALALEPIALEAGQVSQIALVQTAGNVRDFPVRNTNMATAT